MIKTGHQGALLAISPAIFAGLSRSIPSIVVVLSGWLVASQMSVTASESVSAAFFSMVACLTFFIVRVSLGSLLNVQDRWVFFMAAVLIRTTIVFLWIVAFAGLLHLYGQSVPWTAILVWALFAICATALVLPAIVWLVLRYFRRREGVSVLLVAINAASIELARRLRDDDWLAVKVHGFLEDRTPDRFPICDDFQLLGRFEEAAKFVKDLHIDRVYLSLPMEAEMRLRPIFDALQDTTASIYFIHDFVECKPIRARLEMICGIPLFGVCEAPSVEAQWFIKSVLDRLFAFTGLVALSPLLLLTALAIKLDSAGPIFYRQPRYGMSGDIFQIWKFRSMTAHQKATGKTVQASKNDARVTRVGKFIRRTSIDELPQLFNILSGEMSLVGPRPHAADHNETYRQLIQGYMIRHKVRPGLTGWAQVNGWRGETDTLDKMEQRVIFDLEYLRLWSVWFDFYILARTVTLVLSAKNAH